MGTQTNSARTLAESSAAALSEAADELSSACSPAAFQAALETNYRVWSVLDRHRGLAVPGHLTSFALNTAGQRGKGVPDAHVEALIRVNREVSQALASASVREQHR